MCAMNWSELLSPLRERASRRPKMADDHRSAFDMDYDRVVYSSSLRRLQDKAQVFPLQENDFTRTRLTHSLETSAIGRSLGVKVGRWICRREPGLFPEEYIHQLSTLLQVAGLVHDLGNPPFGHYGEELIKAWFRDPQNPSAGQLSEDERLDFARYDGNAQTIRILTRLQFLKDRHGLNFCFGSLGTLLKYPWPASDPRAGAGKFGYFISERDVVSRVIAETGLTGRHPVTYLLEAADDLAYLFADLEDAVKKGHLPWPRVYKELIGDDALWAHFPESRESLERDVRQLESSSVPPEEIDLISARYFKLCGQVMGINAVCGEFADNYERIMNGTYDRTLLKAETVAPFIKKVRAVCVEYAYSNDEVLSLELVAKSVLTTLLDRFIPAVLSDEAGDARAESGKLYRLISRNFEYIQKLDENSAYQKDRRLSPYQRVQLGIDFISGMTDSYALKLHKRLLGLELPEHR
ncbi:MAG: dNTP triphosphohydrolase [Candidatus Adiutrix sp.]|jgi:dGTPase|nr:dNTP triphosphohydrolase [Candidatus Adiutrix sp.]